MNARKGLFEMDGERKTGGVEELLDHYIERTKRVEEMLRATQEELEATRKGKRRKTNKPRSLSRNGEEAAFFIDRRDPLVRAHKRGGFDGVPITSRDLLDLHREQGGLCRYTGMPYEFSRGEPLSVSVDRLDHSQGWTRGNVVLCCLFASVARNGWPLELVVPLWRFLPRKVAK